MNTVLLLMEPGRNRELLATWLDADYEVQLGSIPEGEAATFDLCILDRPSLSRFGGQLASWKADQEPVFLPFLLVTPNADRLPPRILGDHVDEIVDTPIEQAHLAVRIEGLLERRRLTSELASRERRSRGRFRSLFGAVPDPVFVFDDAGRVHEINDALARLTGHEPAALEGESLDDIEVFPADTVEALRGDDRTDAHDLDRHFEVQYRTREGDVRVASVVTAPIPGSESGERIAVLRDVTERKQTLRELRRQNDRLDEFASMLAHELRNPLGIASGYLKLCREGGDPDAFDQVSDALTRMGEMIDQLLLLTRRGEIVGETSMIDLRSLVETAWSRVETEEATLSMAATDVVIAADVERLSEAFENFFRNAIEHAGSDVTVRVGWLPDGGGFYVEDDGPGIDPDERENIFKRGYSTGGEGTGLGLPIVKQIVEAHGWTPHVIESADGGARFEIRGVTPV